MEKPELVAETNELAFTPASEGKLTIIDVTVVVVDVFIYFCLKIGLLVRS